MANCEVLSTQVTSDCHCSWLQLRALAQTGIHQCECKTEDWISNLSKCHSCCTVRSQERNQEVQNMKQIDNCRKKKGNMFRYKERIASTIISHICLLLLSTYPDAKHCSIKRGHRRKANLAAWQAFFYKESNSDYMIKLLFTGKVIL